MFIRCMRYKGSARSESFSCIKWWAPEINEMSWYSYTCGGTLGLCSVSLLLQCLAPLPVHCCHCDCHCYCLCHCWYCCHSQRHLWYCYVYVVFLLGCCYWMQLVHSLSLYVMISMTYSSKNVSISISWALSTSLSPRANLWQYQVGYNCIHHSLSFHSLSSQRRRNSWALLTGNICKKYSQAFPKIWPKVCGAILSWVSSLSVLHSICALRLISTIPDPETSVPSVFSR